MGYWPLSAIKLDKNARWPFWRGVRGFGVFCLLGTMLGVPHLNAALAPDTPGSVANSPTDARTTMRESIKEVPAGLQPALAGGPVQPHIVRANLQPQEENAVMEFNVSLKMRNFAELQSRLNRGEIISPAEMAANYLPLSDDFNATANWLRQQGFTIDPKSRGMLIFARGTVAQVRAAFQTAFARVATADGEFTSAVTAPNVPAGLAPALIGINGLQPHLRKHPHLKQPDSASSFVPPYFPKQIAIAYGANSLTQTGTGQTIAVVMDAFPLNSDLTTFWTTSSIPQTTANITDVTVSTGPPTGGSADALGYEEVCLDVEWSSSIASAAKVRVYGVPGLDDVSLDAAYQQIYTDAINHPQLGLSVASFSYGGSEGTAAQLNTDDALFAQLTSAGVTVFASSGDEGAIVGAESPASDPNVTGVGGTSITLNTTTGAVISENAWVDTGGNSSSFFTKPIWQTGTGVQGTVANRMVPDVAAPADPNTGCLIVYNGLSTTVGGTSWSSPTWAGFCALMNQARLSNGETVLGALNPKIYPLLGTACFRDIVNGQNGGNNAGIGYDMCTGVGVPVFPTLLQQLITVLTPPVSQEVAAGQNATFKLTAGSVATSFQWQRMAAGTSTWVNLTSGSTYQGVASSNLTVSSATAAMSGDQFQCVLNNAITPPATLVVVVPAYAVSTLAGQVGVAGSNDGVGANAQFNLLNDVALDASGNIYVADTLNDTVRKVTPAGNVTTLTGAAGITGTTNGALNIARFNFINSIDLDASGNIYLCDSSNNAIRKISINGTVSTLAGPATNARLNFPDGIAVDASGNVFVCDANNNTIRRVTQAGVIATLAGRSGTAGFANGTGTNAQFNFPSAIAVDASGNLYVADSNNNAIRKLTPSGGAYVVTTLAGPLPSQGALQGIADGTGSFARFNYPSGIAVDSSGNIYVTDTNNNTIRKITPAGVVTTLLGQATVQGSADGIGAASQFNQPYGLVLNSAGTIYIADSVNDTLRVAVAAVAPQIQAPPASLTANVGDTPSFSVIVNGTPTLTYQWQRLPAGGSTWANLTDNNTYSGSATASLTISSALSTMNGDQFRCFVANSVGNATSAAAALTVQSPPSFTLEPVAIALNVGDTAEFSATAVGQPTPTYQWQVLTSDGSGWVNLTDNSTFAGTGTSRLSVIGAANTLNGAQFSCVASNGISPNATSSSALLTVYPVGYLSWAAGLNLAGTSVSLTATPFTDTLPNLARFAMNIGATPASGQLPALSVQVVNGIAYLRLDYNVSKNLSGLQVVAQSSNDLKTWQNLSNAAVAQLADPNAQTSHYQASIQIPANGMVFLRLAIQPQ